MVVDSVGLGSASAVASTGAIASVVSALVVIIHFLWHLWQKKAS